MKIRILSAFRPKPSPSFSQAFPKGGGRGETEYDVGDGEPRHTDSRCCFSDGGTLKYIDVLKYFSVSIVYMNRRKILSKMKNTEIILRSCDCTGCGRCTEACRHGVLQLANDGVRRIVQVVDAERCTACRSCEHSCAHGAIVVRKIAGAGYHRSRAVQGLLPLVLALVLVLPWSLDANDWSAINYWKIFGCFVLLHHLFGHIRFSGVLKNKHRS